MYRTENAPIVEAAAAIAMADLLLIDRGIHGSRNP